jgi:WD40 repeat protein
MTSAVGLALGELALADSFGAVHIMHTDDLQRRPRLEFKANTGSVSSMLATNDNMLVTASRTDASAVVWNTWTGRSEKTLIGHRGGIVALAFNTQGDIITSGADQTIRTWGIPPQESPSRIA